MLRSPKLALGAVASMLALVGIAALPPATAADATSADTTATDTTAADCTVIVTLTTGQQETFSLPVGATITVTQTDGQQETFPLPVGSPISSQVLPPGVANLSDSCAPPTPTTTPSTPPTTTTTTTSPPATSSPSSPPPTTTTSRSHKPGTRPRRQRRSSHPATHRHTSRPKPKTTSTSSSPQKPASKPSTKPTQNPGGGGALTPSNPTFSYSLPGQSATAVPNFFIENFQIPPFLLPIYQAAGIEYNVPWQVLAAINEIETDYGRNLSVSSAGAVGWMQFLPSTWKQYAVAATDNGVADPYNPVDAIFTAARYLQAAGASKNLSQAVFAYNHATWYVQSVLLRAKLIGGLPDQFIGALTGLVEGHFPVAARAKYADDYVEQLATRRVKAGNPAIAIQSDPSQKAIAIYAKQNSPVIAANDGKVLAVGQNAQWGKYLELQDANGNVYTYANLGSIPKEYPVPKPVPVTAADIAKELSAQAVQKPNAPATAGSQQTPKPSAPASAGSQQSPPVPSTKTASNEARSAAPLSLPGTGSAAVRSVPTAQVKERLFAYPSRPASYAAGGALQLQNETQQISSFQDYFSDVLHLGKNQYTLKALKPGAVVVAGTIIGRIAAPRTHRASHVEFMIKPAGKGSPYIDPKPILDGWKLLTATAVYRAAGLNPFAGKNPSIGQILLMSKEQLQNRVLQDPHVQIYSCGRRDIQAGLVDRRVLAVIEFLSASGLNPTVSGLVCGANAKASNGVDADGATGASVDISKINGMPIAGHQGAGSITDITIRHLLTLQGIFKPTQIISTMSYKSQSNTLSLPDHANRIQVSYTPESGNDKKLTAQVASILNPGQWVQLINRIDQLPEPVVAIAPSKYAVKIGH